MELNPDQIGKFIALGGTFHSHQEEKNRSYRWPDFWIVPDEAIITEGETIEIPEKAEEIKPGAEITAVIGEDIHQASEEEAWKAIKGFTISNDVTSAGDWPGWSDPDHENITGVGYKTIATFSPILTEFQPKEELKHYQDLDIEVKVDGEVSVSGNTKLMAFTIPEMVAFASQIVPLEENDVIALGDPGSPSKTLDSAESVKASIESIGELENPIERL